MRIGLSCTAIEPILTHGKIDGIGTYTQNLYDFFIHSGQHVIPISFPNKILTQSSFSNGKLFPFTYTESSLRSFIKPLSTSLKQDIDLFHVTDYMLPKLKDIPIVASVHDATMFKYPEWFFTSKVDQLKKWLRKKSLNWADRIITGSQSMVSELVDYCGIPPEKISVIYDGISPWWSEILTEEEKKIVLKKFNLPNNFILFNGTLHPKKNLPRLIEAYLQLDTDIKQEYPLIITGRTSWIAEESLLAIKKLGGYGRWLDYISIEELRALFQSATLLAHPSLHEGFGLTLLQAFASKKPVLTSNVTAMPETAAGAAYLVNPESIEEIRDGLTNLLTNSTLRNKLINKGSKRVEDFSWEKCALETMQVYQSLLGNL